MKKRRQISKVDQIHERALIFAEALKKARELGKITYSSTRSGRTIAEQLNAFYHWEPPISGDAGVRELVNHCRTLGIPIVGDGKGYAYGTNSAELIPTIADLKSRIAHISQALHGLEKCARQMEQVEADIFRQLQAVKGNGTTNALPDVLTKHFELEPVEKEG